MDKVTFPEMLKEAQKLADDELLLCRYTLTKFVEMEIEMNNEGLVTLGYLKSPDKHGFTLTHLFLALSMTIGEHAKYKEWEC